MQKLRKQPSQFKNIPTEMGVNSQSSSAWCRITELLLEVSWGHRFRLRNKLYNLHSDWMSQRDTNGFGERLAMLKMNRKINWVKFSFENVSFWIILNRICSHCGYECSFLPPLPNPNMYINLCFRIWNAL